MNRTPALIALALAAAAFAGVASAETGLAGDITIETTPFVSSRSRAEVRAELDAFKKSKVNPWSRSYNPLASFKSTKTSAEVRAEYIANRDAVSALNGEDSGSRYLAQGAARAQQAARAAAPQGASVQQ